MRVKVSARVRGLRLELVLGFRVSSLGFRVKGLGFRAEG
jgi:hypothetical protein